jgi:hypothetical protein
MAVKEDIGTQRHRRPNTRRRRRTRIREIHEMFESRQR